MVLILLRALCKCFSSCSQLICLAWTFLFVYCPYAHPTQNIIDCTSLFAWLPICPCQVNFVLLFTNGKLTFCALEKWISHLHLVIYCPIEFVRQIPLCKGGPYYQQILREENKHMGFTTSQQEQHWSAKQFLLPYSWLSFVTRASTFIIL